MKSKVLIQLMLCFALNGRTQTDFRLQHFETASIYKLSSHALYIPNPSGVKQKVSCDGCVYLRPSEEEENTYELFPESVDSITITVKVGTKTIQHSYKVRNLPSVQVYLDGYSHQNPIKINRIKGNIRVSYPPEIERIREGRCRIYCWELSTDNFVYKANGNQLSSDALQMIRNSKTGREFELIVKYICPGGCPRTGILKFKVE